MLRAVGVCAAILSLSACGVGGIAGGGEMAVRAGPQALHPGDAARGLTVRNPAAGGVAALPVTSTTQSGGSSVAQLFAQICEAYEPDFAGSVDAAIASGAFGAPSQTVSPEGTERTVLQSPDGQVEVIVAIAGPTDPIGDSCGIGTRDGSETYVILPTGSIRP